MRARQVLSILLTASPVLGAVLLSPCEAAAQSVPSHLLWAEELVDNLLPEYNVYATSPQYVSWAGEHSATRYENRTQCSSFLTRLLQQGYGWSDTTMRYWLGSTSPSSVMYHDAIVAERGFDRIATITDVLPGDIIAIRYPVGSSISGHISIVESAPILRIATTPLREGTFQYEVSVADSASIGHGMTDTRIQPNGTWHAGAGIGVMRLYADAYGTVVGHTWSTAPSTTSFYSQATRRIVIGRLQLAER